MMLVNLNSAATKAGWSESSKLPLVQMLILLSGFLSALLRLDEESDLTLFRALLPVVVLSIVFYDMRRFSYLLAAMIYFALCQAVAFQLTPYPFDFYNVAFFLNYSTMLIFGWYVYVLNEKFDWSSIDKFFTVYFYFLLAILLLQLVFHFSLPNIPRADQAANGWYGNENDASLALAAFVFYAARFGMIKKHAPGLVAAIIVMAANGSRTCLLAVAILSYYVFMRRFGKVVTIYLTAAMAALGSIYVFYFVDGIDLVEEFFVFVENLFAAIEGLVNLEVTVGVFTSLGVRSVAAVLALIDFTYHPLLGTGAGNTISLIAQNSSIFNDAIKSTHNMPLMMLAELGILGLLAFIFPIFRMSKIKGWNFAFWFGLFLFSSLSQSGGFITNFFVLAAFVVVLARPDFSKKNIEGEAIEANPIGRPA